MNLLEFILRRPVLSWSSCNLISPVVGLSWLCGPGSRSSLNASLGFGWITRNADPSVSAGASFSVDRGFRIPLRFGSGVGSFIASRGLLRSGLNLSIGLSGPTVLGADRNSLGVLQLSQTRVSDGRVSGSGFIGRWRINLLLRFSRRLGERSFLDLRVGVLDSLALSVGDVLVGTSHEVTKRQKSRLVALVDKQQRTFEGTSFIRFGFLTLALGGSSVEEVRDDLQSILEILGLGSLSIGSSLFLEQGDLGLVCLGESRLLTGEAIFEVCLEGLELVELFFKLSDLTLDGRLLLKLSLLVIVEFAGGDKVINRLAGVLSNDSVGLSGGGEFLVQVANLP